MSGANASPIGRSHLWMIAEICTLKLASVLFYLQSLCPIAAPLARGMPPFLRALLAPAEPTGVLTSIATIATVVLLVLFIGSLQANKLEINYSAD
jgi:hypothetical protein